MVPVSQGWFFYLDGMAFGELFLNAPCIQGGLFSLAGGNMLKSKHVVSPGHFPSDRALKTVLPGKLSLFGLTGLHLVYVHPDIWPMVPGAFMETLNHSLQCCLLSAGLTCTFESCQPP